MLENDSIKNNISMFEQNTEIYKILFQEANDAIFILEKDKYIICNDKALTILNCSREEIIGSSPTDFSPEYQANGERSKDQVKHKINKVISGESQAFEWIHQRFDGELFYADVTLNGFDVDGNYYIIAIVRDITFKKKNEEQIRESERKYRLLTENMNDLIWELDQQLNFSYVSPSIYKITGFTPVELLGNNLFDFIEYDLVYLIKDELSLRIEEFSKNGIINESKYEIKFLCKNGSFIWLEALSNPIINSDNKLLGFQGVGRDISERKISEQILSENEIRYRAIFESSPNSIVVNNLITGEYIDVNPAFLLNIGMNKEDVIGKTSSELNFFKNSEDDENIKNYLFEKNMISGVELKTILQNGEPNWIDYTAVKVNLGSVPAAITMTTNITERKLAEEKIVKLNAELENKVKERTAELKNTLEKLQESNIELQVLNDQVMEDAQKIVNLNTDLLDSQDELKELLEQLKESNERIEASLYQKNALVEELYESEAKLKEIVAIKDKFFSIVAHDIRGPFSGFLGLTDLMAKNAKDLASDDVASMSNNINKAANVVHTLIEDLFLWSRTQTDSIPFVLELLDLKDICDLAIRSFNQTALAKNIELSNTITSTIHINADRNMLKTIIRNLVSNAIKFTNDQGRIEIGIDLNKFTNSDSSSKYLVVYVKDNGIGISQSNIEKLFKLDVNVTTIGTNKEKGSGLGLILCKEFAEKHGGKIWAESEEGKGSTFFFALPDVR